MRPQRPAPEADGPSSPLLGHLQRGEVVLRRVEPRVRRRMVRGEQEPSRGPQDPADLAEDRVPVLQVVEDQRRDHEVEGRVRGEAEPGGEVGHQNLRRGAEAVPGKADHRRADVDGGHLRAVLDQPLRQRSGSAADLEDPESLHVAEHGDHRRPLVVGVEGARRVGRGVVPGHGVVLGRRPPAVGGEHRVRRDRPVVVGSHRPRSVAIGLCSPRDNRRPRRTTLLVRRHHPVRPAAARLRRARQRRRPSRPPRRAATPRRWRTSDCDGLRCCHRAAQPPRRSSTPGAG